MTEMRICHKMDLLLCLEQLHVYSELFQRTSWLYLFSSTDQQHEYTPYNGAPDS
ncbi:hypothetical protein ACSS6W_004411 [Trichoderma asperelloides]